MRADSDALLDLVTSPTGRGQAAAELQEGLDVYDVLSFVDKRLQVTIFAHLEIRKEFIRSSGPRLK